MNTDIRNVMVAQIFTRALLTFCFGGRIYLRMIHTSIHAVINIFTNHLLICISMYSSQLMNVVCSYCVLNSDVGSEDAP